MVTQRPRVGRSASEASAETVRPRVAGRRARGPLGRHEGGPPGPPGDDAVRGGVVAVSDAERSSLDPGKNNSTEPDDGESDRYDCREVYRNFQFESADGETASYRCGSWDCYCCGYRMRCNLVEEVQRVTTSRPEMSRLLTLTLDPTKAPASQERQHYYITERWNALRTRLKREIGDFSYIWVREEQENGTPHLHALVSRYLPWDVVDAAWKELGGGHVDLRKVDRVEKAAHYIGKYLTKDAMTGLPDGIRRYGSSSDISLAVRGGGDSDGDWRLLMDDYQITAPDGGPLRRGVATADFVRQKEWDGPVPPDVDLGG